MKLVIQSCVSLENNNGYIMGQNDIEVQSFDVKKTENEKVSGRLKLTKPLTPPWGVRISNARLLP